MIFTFLFIGLLQAQDIEHGKYMAQAAGCLNCHTADRSAPLAGGVKITTDFGTFYAPNISRDERFGIGRWSDADFLRAVKRGISPKREYYYPAFPFTAYRKLTDADVLAIRAYLNTFPAQAVPSKAPQLGFPYSERRLLYFWRKLNFKQKFLTAAELRTFKYQGDFRAKKDRSASWNRGAYLAEAAFHCTECHTPRNRLGGLNPKLWMAGARFNGEELAGNITPHPRAGLGTWSAEDWELFLTTGETPDGGEVSGDMYRIVRTGTAKLTPSDRAALIDYLQDLKSVNLNWEKEK